MKLAELAVLDLGMEISFTEREAIQRLQNCFWVWESAKPEIEYLQGREIIKRATRECSAHLSEKDDIILYILQRLDIIFRDNYTPTDLDCLCLSGEAEDWENCHLALGNNERKFNIECTDIGKESVQDTIQDINKWRRNSPDRNVIIVFTIAVSDFDLVDPENENKNKLQLQLENLEILVNAFQNEPVGIMISFTKLDVLEKKLRYQSLKSFFPNFEGEETPPIIFNYFENIVNQKTKKMVCRYIDQVNGLDQELVQNFIFQGLNQMIDLPEEVQVKESSGFRIPCCPCLFISR